MVILSTKATWLAGLAALTLAAVPMSKELPTFGTKAAMVQPLEQFAAEMLTTDADPCETACAALVALGCDQDPPIFPEQCEQIRKSMEEANCPPCGDDVYLGPLPPATLPPSLSLFEAIGGSNPCEDVCDWVEVHCVSGDSTACPSVCVWACETWGCDCVGCDRWCAN